PDTPLTDIKDSNVAIDAKSEVVVQSPIVTPVQPTAEVSSKTELVSLPPKGDDSSNAQVISFKKENRVDTKSPSETNYEMNNNKVARKNRTQTKLTKFVKAKSKKEVKASYSQSAVYYCIMALVVILGSILGLKALKKEK
ncbi:hypothetical protein ACEE32_10520, partial [Streptococcus thoraltensis]